MTALAALDFNEPVEYSWSLLVHCLLKRLLDVGDMILMTSLKPQP